MPPETGQKSLNPLGFAPARGSGAMASPRRTTCVPPSRTKACAAMRTARATLAPAVPAAPLRYAI